MAFAIKNDRIPRGFAGNIRLDHGEMMETAGTGISSKIAGNLRIGMDTLFKLGYPYPNVSDI